MCGVGGWVCVGKISGKSGQLLMAQTLATNYILHIRTCESLTAIVHNLSSLAHGQPSCGQREGGRERGREGRRWKKQLNKLL